MISIDIIGELPSSQNNSKYIFVVIDCFSRYVWAEAMSKCTAASVVKYLCESVFPNNGCPKTIISDNGVQFKLRVLNTILLREITHRPTRSKLRTRRLNRRLNPIYLTILIIRNGKFASIRYFTILIRHRILRRTNLLIICILAVNW